MNQPSNIQFPTEFPVKVMGRQGTDLMSLSRAIIERHAGTLSAENVRVRDSADRNYLGITFLIRATSREQLDVIYRELTACPAVLMAL